MTSQDTEALKALVALAKKATPPEWQTRFLHRMFKSARKDPELLFETRPEQDWADCEFMAAARNTIPALERMLASQTQEPLQKVTELAGIALATVVKGPDEDGEHWCSICDAMLEDETTGHKATCASRVLRDIYEISSAAAPVASQMGEPYKTALAKINCIRNSIIGMQGFHFSMHAYPLVAALNAAGFEGMSYEDAKAYHTKLRETGKLPGEEIPDVAAPAAGMDAEMLAQVIEGEMKEWDGMDRQLIQGRIAAIIRRHMVK